MSNPGTELGVTTLYAMNMRLLALTRLLGLSAIALATLALTACGQRSEYNPFGAPANNNTSGVLDERPLNGK